MPKPTYERERRPSRRERRFGEIAQALQLQEGVARPQREQEELTQRANANNLNAVLQLLGIGTQAQEGSANRAIQERQLTQQGQLAADRNAVDLLTLMAGGNVAPGVTETASAMDPRIAAGMRQAQQASTAKAAGVLEPQVRALYQSGMSPEKMSPMLEALKLPNPAAFDALPWDQLNALIPGLTPPPTPEQDFERGISPAERGIRDFGSGLVSGESLKGLFGAAHKSNKKKPQPTK